MPDLIPWPFPLPEQFLDQLGYARTVEAFESPAMRAHITDLLRRQGITEPQPIPTGPRRYVMLYWEPAGDELAFADGVHSAAGQLHHWVWLDYLRGRGQFGGPMYGWLVEHQVDLGSSDAPATHALLVDADSGSAWVAPIVLARRIVRAQSLGQDPQP
jgi:hypothetical protein